MFKIFRAQNWWTIIIPQILGWVYFCELRAANPFMFSSPQKVFYFVGGVLAIAAFGYAFNDLCDIDIDSAAGKKNHLSGLNKPIRILAVLIPLATGIFFWYQVKAGVFTNVLYGLQVIALVVYSTKPFRLKEKSLAGVITDAFYGHINPALFTLGTFTDWTGQAPGYTTVLLTILVVSTTLKGVRNILLHQLHDRKNDKAAGINTFVTQNGGVATLYFINNILKYEVLFTALLAITISYALPPFFLSILLFGIFTYLKFSGWKLAYLPKRQLQFKFLYFLNDYYEGWVPVFFLILLSVGDNRFLIVLLLHLVFFPTFLIKLWQGAKTIRQNFKTEDDY